MLPLVFAMFACGGLYDTGGSIDDSDDTDVVDYPDTGDTDVEVGTDTGEPDDTDVDPGDVFGCHAWDPVELDGWTRVYDVKYKAKKGTETHTGAGLDVDSDGNPMFIVDIESGVEGAAAGTYGYACDLDEPGAYLTEANTSMSLGMLGELPILITNNPAYRYLPGAGTIGSEGSWEYSYSKSMAIEGLPLELPMSGLFVEMGFESVTTPAGTFKNAYHVTETYTEDRSALSMFEMLGIDASNIEAFSDRWYVEGIGLVKEKTVDVNDPSVVLSEHVLKSFKGLTAK